MRSRHPIFTGCTILKTGTLAQTTLTAIQYIFQRAGYADQVEVGLIFETRLAASIVGRMIPSCKEFRAIRSHPYAQCVGFIDARRLLFPVQLVEDLVLDGSHGTDSCAHKGKGAWVTICRGHFVVGRTASGSR